jgi:hypothetical protein
VPLIGAAAAVAAGGAAVKWARGRPPAPVRPALRALGSAGSPEAVLEARVGLGAAFDAWWANDPDAARDWAAQLTDGLGRPDERGLGEILLVGITGVGKSTLANAVLGRRLAATGSGAPVTRGVSRHRSRDGLTTLVDTEGLELGEVDARRREHLLALAALADSVWYCVQAGGERFQASEAELIEALAAVRPTIVVLTQALEPPAELARLIRAHHAEIPVVALLAEERVLGGRTFRRGGLGALLEATRRMFDCHDPPATS